MSRNLKALGLALVAMLALGAVIASAASAQQGELTSDGPVTLKGTETGAEGANAFTAFGRTLSCPGSTYTGHAVLTNQQTEEGNKHGLITPPVTEGTLTPHFNQEACTTSNGEDVTIETNGCDLRVQSGETVGENEYGGSGELICPTGKKAHAGVWANGSNHTEGRLCTLEFGSQEGSGGLRVINTPESGDVDISGSISGIHMERHGLCLLDGKGTTDNNGKVHIDATVKGLTQEGATTAISASD